MTSTGAPASIEAIQVTVGVHMAYTDKTPVTLLSHPGRQSLHRLDRIHDDVMHAFNDAF